MKDVKEKFVELEHQIADAYSNHLEQCAHDRVEIADVFNVALRAFAAQTTKIILQSSIITGGDDKRDVNKAIRRQSALFHNAICDEAFKTLQDAYDHFAEEKEQ